MGKLRPETTTIRTRWTLPVTLQVTATTSLAGVGAVGDEVNMSRTVGRAIPVFQFGVFCDGDCSFFAGPNMQFAGRVHTNGDLYCWQRGRPHLKISFRRGGMSFAPNLPTGTLPPLITLAPSTSLPRLGLSRWPARLPAHGHGRGQRRRRTKFGAEPGMVRTFRRYLQ